MYKCENCGNETEYAPNFNKCEKCKGSVQYVNSTKPEVVLSRPLPNAVMEENGKFFRIALTRDNLEQMIKKDKPEGTKFMLYVNITPACLKQFLEWRPNYDRTRTHK